MHLPDAACGLIAALFVSLVAAPPAFAYVDPSVMTYTIQALAGVAVALGAVAGVALRRTRKWLFKALRIDENANKEVEGAVYRLSSDQAAELDVSTPIYTERSQVREEKEPSWKSRFVVVFLASLLCGITLGISAPFELVVGNASNLTYGLSDIWPIMVIATLVGVVILSLLASLLKGRAFRVVSLLLCSIGLCMYAQTLFMNGGLTLNDNGSIDWLGSHAAIMVISTIVWLILLIVPQVLLRNNQHVSRNVVIAVSLVLIFVQAINVGSLFVSNDLEGDAKGMSFVTKKGVLEVSDKSNVIVMIVDHFDERELDKLVAEDPHLLDFLPGSTVYTNCMETMTPTEFALPYMVTAVLPDVGEDINGSYLCRRYTEGSFLQAMANAGYTVGIYSDSLRLQHLSNTQMWDCVGRYTENIHPVDDQRLDAEHTLRILLKAALYRDLPWILKPPFVYTTSDLNVYMVARDEAVANPDEQPFESDDVGYYHRFIEEGLKIESDGGTGNFRLIHFDGNHFPWTKNEDVEEVGSDATNRDADAIASIKIVEAYVQCLKNLGVYEKSTIIITADHGDWETHELPVDASVPMLIVKPAGDGESQTSAPRYSAAPVAHEDMFATILEAMGANGGEYGSTLSQIEEAFANDSASRPRVTYMAAANKGFTIITDLFQFTVRGDAREWSSWTYDNIAWHVEDGD